MNYLEIARISKLSGVMDKIKSLVDYQIHYQPASGHNNAYLNVEVNIDRGSGIQSHLTHAVEFDTIRLIENDETTIRKMLYRCFPALESLEKEQRARTEWRSVVELAKAGNNTLVLDKDTVLFVNDRLAELKRVAYGV